MITSKMLIAKFGDTRVATVRIEYERKNMILWHLDTDIRDAIPALPSRIYLHGAMIPYLQLAFRELIKKGLHTEIKTYDGCFNVRDKRGSRAVSLHAYGLAIDLNAAWNRFGGTVEFSQEFLHVWRNNGFDCGADWKMPYTDGMHFQLKNIPK